MDAIGIELRRLRTAMGLTLMEFGKRVGVPWQSIARYEAGRGVPPSDRLLQILYATRGLEEPFRIGRVARAVARSAA